jgi:tetratricopeptide (TPR) repeat protein
LGLAVTAAHNIENADWRKSALVRVSEAQTEAGDFVAALATAGEIEGVVSMLHLSPLRTIAEAQAAAGDARGALVTAQMLTEGLARASALIGVASALAAAGNVEGTRDAVKAAWAATESMPRDSLRASALARIAIVAKKAGDFETAEKALNAALAIARSLDPNGSDSLALRWIAEAQATAGNVEAALATAIEVQDVTHRSEAVASVAAAEAAARDFSAALATAEKIEHPNVLVEAWSGIAKAQAAAGYVAEARDTIARALATAKAIPINWEATSYLWAMSHVVEAQAAIGDIEAAIDAVEAIEDDYLRIVLVGQVAAADVVSGQVEGLAATVQGIKRSLARAMTLAALAKAKAKLRDLDAARKLSKAALSTAAEIGALELRALVLKTIAMTQAHSGDADGVAESLQAIAAIAPLDEFDNAWRYTRAPVLKAEAEARAGNAAIALTTAEKLEDRSWRVEALIAIAAALSY